MGVQRSGARWLESVDDKEGIGAVALVTPLPPHTNQRGRKAESNSTFSSGIVIGESGSVVGGNASPGHSVGLLDQKDWCTSRQRLPTVHAGDTQSVSIAAV